MALTTKQERFCQNIVSGMTNIDSYMDAYNSKSPIAANVESTKLLQRDDIRERLEELKKPIVTLVQSQAISARQKQIDFIKERIEICKQKEDENSLIRWSDQLNKILALYKETETEQKQSNSVDNLDTDTLKKLSGIA